TITYTPSAVMIFLLILTTLIQTGSSIRCYECQNFNSENDNWFYDETCGDIGYDDSISENEDWEYCRVDVYGDGGLGRGENGAGVSFDDGQCFEFSSYTSCYCSTDLCNDGICYQCFDPTTPHSTTPRPTKPGGSTTTTQPGTGTTPTTQPGTGTTPTTTPGGPTIPGEGLSCYSCVDCADVDENTDLDKDPAFKSCFTMALTS
ncbi:unnamed protein product, partial [Meganyctiphanes norvegica]